jgi:hypothetical protein
LSQFTTELNVRPLSDGKNWVLLDEFSYDVGFLDSGDTITVPAGFVTDFTSIPKLAWSIIGGPWGKYGKAAVIHDYLFATQQRGWRKANQIFLEGMKVLGVSWWKRTAMYSMVAAFSWVSWLKAKKKYQAALKEMATLEDLDE